MQSVFSEIALQCPRTSTQVHRYVCPDDPLASTTQAEADGDALKSGLSLPYLHPTDSVSPQPHSGNMINGLLQNTSLEEDEQQFSCVYLHTPQGADCREIVSMKG